MYPETRLKPGTLKSPDEDYLFLFTSYFTSTGNFHAPVVRQEAVHIWSFNKLDRLCEAVQNL